MQQIIVVAHYSHALIVTDDGSLWACGDNEYGALGDRTLENVRLPIKILEDVNAAAAGCDFSLAVKKDKSLWALGYNLFGQLGDGTNIDKLIIAIPIYILGTMDHCSLI